MTFLFNYLQYSKVSFSSGFFTSRLKTAKTIAVHKKGCKLDFSNYRPILLVSNIEKIVEKLMGNRIYNFFSDNNLINPFQFGFRQKYSTIRVIIILTECIRKNLEDGNIVCGIFVDLQIAFDTVEHDILLSELELYGLCRLANQWL